MIRDGRMPTPEDAHTRLEERLRRDELGEPMEIIGAPDASGPKIAGEKYLVASGRLPL
jgi:hypothetical protein